MIINVFTVRSKADNSLIYAEGCQHSEYVSDFELSSEWLDADDYLSESWHHDSDNNFTFQNEVRFLLSSTFKLVKFGIEELNID